MSPEPSLPMPLPYSAGPLRERAARRKGCKWCGAPIGSRGDWADETELAWGGCMACLSALDV